MTHRVWWHRPVAWVLKRLLSLYVWTLQIQEVGRDQAKSTLTNSPRGCILLLWHDSILMSLCMQWMTELQPLCLLISNSKDGDLASEIGCQYPHVSVFRVKHSSRSSAVIEGCSLLKQRCSLFITPDGPRGPRHQMKKGALFLCQKSDAVILPVVCVASRQWTLSSWDRFRIPFPFSRIIVSYLEPVTCPSDSDVDSIGRQIEQRMEEEETALTRMF